MFASIILKYVYYVVFSKLSATMKNKEFDCIQLACKLADIVTMKSMLKTECAQLIVQCLDSIIVPFLDNMLYPAAVSAAFCIVNNKIWPGRRFMISFVTFAVTL
jgi:hypothetical protein